MASGLHFEEEDQIEDLKRFWGKWGNWILAIAVIIILGFVAWNYYKHHLREKSTQASVLFDTLSGAVEKKDAALMRRSFSDMKTQYAGTVYAQQAGLLMAQSEVDSNQLDEALSSLKWVSAQSGDASLADLAKLRMTSIMLTLGKPNDAIAVLKAPFPSAFYALVHDRLGDAYSALGKEKEAKEAYIDAYQNFNDTNEAYQKLIAVKLNALGVDTTSLAIPK